MPRWCWILVLPALLSGTTAVNKGCPEPTRNAGSTVEPQGHYQYGIVGRVVTLICDVSGNANVTWCKMAPGDGSCKPFPWGSGPFWQDNHVIGGKIFRIKRAYIEDSGTYHCASADDGEGENITLKIIACDNISGEIYVACQPTPRKAAEIGTTVHLPCQGYFGCMRSSAFKKAGVTWIWTTVSDSTSSRISIHQHPFDPDTQKMGAVLTLRDVSEVDYGTVFRCILHNDRINKSFTVELVKPDASSRFTIYVLSGGLASVIIIFVVAVVFVYCFAWNIFKYHCCPHKRPKRSEAETYDALLLPSDTTECFVREHISPALAAYHLLDDIPANKPKLTSILEALRVCTSLVIVKTSSDEDKTWRFIYTAACTEKGGRKIVVVDVADEDIDEDDESSQPLPHRDSGLAGFDASASHGDQEDHSDGGDGDSTDSVFSPTASSEPCVPVAMAEPVPEGVPDSWEETLKACTNLRWPGKRSRALKTYDFWCALKCSLPRPQKNPKDRRDVTDDVDRREHSSTSSASFLLRHASARSEEGKAT